MAFMRTIAETRPSQTWIRPERTRENPLQVSGREHDLVYSFLRLPQNYFHPGMKILSIGEGLSDFAKDLCVEKGADAIAIDPIYQIGRAVLQTDPKRVQDALRDAYDGRVVYKSGYQSKQDEVLLPDPKKIAAAEIYNLPFTDGTFDTVFANQLLAYIDLSRAVPELVRVVKPGGEIRIGGRMLQVGIADDSKVLIPGLAHNPPYTYRDEFIEGEGVHEALQFLKSRNLSAYVVIDEIAPYYRTSPFQKTYEAQTLIIRTDDQWPQTTPLQNEEFWMRSIFARQRGVDEFPELGRVLRIVPEFQRADKLVPFDRYYPLSEAGFSRQ